MNETKDDLKREKVRIVPISNIEDFPDHPFQVKDDESMDALVESIRMNGVLNPVIALKIDENHYQLISGHRRKHACVLLGIDRIPLIGREMTKEEAVIEMVDSNLQREHNSVLFPCDAFLHTALLPSYETLSLLLPCAGGGFFVYPDSKRFSKRLYRKGGDDRVGDLYS